MQPYFSPSPIHPSAPQYQSSKAILSPKTLPFSQENSMLDFQQPILKKLLNDLRDKNETQKDHYQQQIKLQQEEISRLKTEINQKYKLQEKNIQISALLQIQKTEYSKLEIKYKRILHEKEQIVSHKNDQETQIQHLQTQIKEINDLFSQNKDQKLISCKIAKENESLQKDILYTENLMKDVSFKNQSLVTENKELESKISTKNEQIKSLISDNQKLSIFIESKSPFFQQDLQKQEQNDLLILQLTKKNQDLMSTSEHLQEKVQDIQNKYEKLFQLSEEQKVLINSDHLNLQNLCVEMKTGLAQFQNKVTQKIEKLQQNFFNRQGQFVKLYKKSVLITKIIKQKNEILKQKISKISQQKLKFQQLFERTKQNYDLCRKQYENFQRSPFVEKPFHASENIQKNVQNIKDKIKNTISLPTIQEYSQKPEIIIEQPQKPENRGFAEFWQKQINSDKDKEIEALKQQCEGQKGDLYILSRHFNSFIENQEKGITSDQTHLIMQQQEQIKYMKEQFEIVMRQVDHLEEKFT